MDFLDRLVRRQREASVGVRLRPRGRYEPLDPGPGSAAYLIGESANPERAPEPPAPAARRVAQTALLAEGLRVGVKQAMRNANDDRVAANAARASLTANGRVERPREQGTRLGPDGRPGGTSGLVTRTLSRPDDGLRHRQPEALRAQARPDAATSDADLTSQRAEKLLPSPASEREPITGSISTRPRPPLVRQPVAAPLAVRIADVGRTGPEAGAPEPPDVLVHIERVEVRAIGATAPGAPPAADRRRPALSLAAYLESRHGAGPRA